MGPVKLGFPVKALQNYTPRVELLAPSRLANHKLKYYNQDLELNVWIQLTHNVTRGERFPIVAGKEPVKDALLRVLYKVQQGLGQAQN